LPFSSQHHRTQAKQQNCGWFRDEQNCVGGAINVKPLSNYPAVIVYAIYICQRSVVSNPRGTATPLSFPYYIDRVFGCWQEKNEFIFQNLKSLWVNGSCLFN